VSGLLMRTLRGEATERRPVWIMRQAGRYLPEYRALRAKHSFEDLSRNPALAAEVTLQPVQRFPLDAAIIFADLMSPVPALGLSVRFEPGPVLDRSVRTRKQVDALKDPSTAEIAPEVTDALRRVKKELNGNVALLGFAGAPWSLAAYIVQGHSESGFPALRALAAQDAGLVFELLAKLTDLVVRYAMKQAEAGADAVQLFDTWAGLLSLADWTRLVRPHLVQFLDATASLGIPRILFVQDAPHLIHAYGDLSSEALAVDWREDLGSVRQHVGEGKTLQGNIDPAILLAGPDATRRAARELLARVPPRGHIVNLGHGIMPETSLESVQALIEVVHQERHP
jgi:uroporphyrinogen decarboxylase